MAGVGVSTLGVSLDFAMPIPPNVPRFCFSPRAVLRFLPFAVLSGCSVPPAAEIRDGSSSGDASTGRELPSPGIPTTGISSAVTTAAATGGSEGTEDETGVEDNCVELEVARFVRAESSRSAYFVTIAPGLGGVVPDVFRLSYWSEDTGVFELGEGENSSSQTCKQCLQLAVDAGVPQREGTARYFQSAGVMEVDALSVPLDGSLRASLSDVVLTRVAPEPVSYTHLTLPTTPYV